MEAVSSVSNPAAHDVSPRRSGGKCLWCGGPLGAAVYIDVRDRLGIVPGTWSFRRCNDCHSLNLYPRPALDAIPRFYPKGYTVVPDGAQHPGRPLAEWARAAMRKAADCLIYRRFVNRHVGWVAARIGYISRQGRRLCDIGCGAGRHVLAFRRMGFDVVAADIDPDACAQVASKGVTTVQGSIEEVLEQFGPRSFDAVTAFQVIEHLPDVRAFFACCAELLRPGGIVAGVVPAGNGTWCRILGRAYSGIADVPRHLSLPTENGIAQALGTAGFRDVSIARGSVVNVAGQVGLSLVPRSSFSLGRPPLISTALGGLAAVASIPLVAVTELLLRPTELLFAARRC